MNIGVRDVILDLSEQGATLTQVAIKSFVNETFNLGADITHKSFDYLLSLSSSEKRKIAKTFHAGTNFDYFTLEELEDFDQKTEGLDKNVGHYFNSFSGSFFPGREQILSSRSPFPELWSLSYNCDVDRIHSFEVVTTGLIEDILTKTVDLIDLPFNAFKNLLHQFRKTHLPQTTSDQNTTTTSKPCSPAYLPNSHRSNPLKVGKNRRSSRYDVNSDVRCRQVGNQERFEAASSLSQAGVLWRLFSAGQIFCTEFEKYIREMGSTSLQKLFEFDNVDSRSHEELITSSGYPYESYFVHTEDGYINKLERIPRSQSHHAVYLQHGIFENSAAWFTGGTIHSLAYRLYDHGYDVFMGNLRGSEDLLHEDKDIQPKDYWDFTLNEHAFFDIPAFLKFIQQLKEAEFFDHQSKLRQDSTKPPASAPFNSQEEHLEAPPNARKSRPGRSRPPNRASSAKLPKFHIHVVAHSMGAACSIMAIIYARIHQKCHNISKLVLLSPAGYHEKSSHLIVVFGPFLEAILGKSLHSIRFPNELIRRIISKLLQDIRDAPPVRNMFRYIAALIVGGDSIKNPATCLRRRKSFNQSNNAHISSSAPHPDPSSSPASAQLQAEGLPRNGSADFRKHQVSRKDHDHPVELIHNISWNTFNGTSIGVLRHFLQCFISKKFQAFDYGKEKNLQVYGNIAPYDFLDYFHLIDIPTYFIMGLKDALIEPQNVLKQFHTLASVHPQFAFLRTFDCGHLDFTYGGRDEVWSYILGVLPQP